MAADGRSPSAARGLYLLTLFGAFALDVVFLIAFVLVPVDFCLTSREAADYVDLSFVYVRLAAALLTCVCGFVGFSLALRPVRRSALSSSSLARQSTPHSSEKQSAPFATSSRWAARAPLRFCSSTRSRLWWATVPTTLRGAAAGTLFRAACCRPC